MTPGGMTRILTVGLTAVLLTSCQRSPAPSHAKITEFKADPASLASGVTGRLCYGVENATRLDLTPHVETILPSSSNCLDIVPHETTVYTLTAYGPDGKADTRAVEVKVGPPQPGVADLVAKPVSVKRGHPVKVCFKVRNAKSVTARPGKLDRKTNCLVDYPRKTTTYRVTAHGDGHEQDTGTVTVNVLR
jgi:hypothetical protein